MGSFIARQPNGLLCRYSNIVEHVTHYNMTDDEYIEMRAEEAREEAKDVLKNYMRPFDFVKDYFRPYNMTQEKFEKILKEMELPKEQCKFTQI